MANLCCKVYGNFGTNRNKLKLSQAKTAFRQVLLSTILYLLETFTTPPLYCWKI